MYLSCCRPQYRENKYFSRNVVEAALYFKALPKIPKLKSIVSSVALQFWKTPVELAQFENTAELASA
jgi:hypothetical protein